MSVRSQVSFLLWKLRLLVGFTGLGTATEDNFLNCFNRIKMHKMLMRGLKFNYQYIWPKWIFAAKLEKFPSIWNGIWLFLMQNECIFIFYLWKLFHFLSWHDKHLEENKSLSCVKKSEPLWNIGAGISFSFQSWKN